MPPPKVDEVLVYVQSIPRNRPPHTIGMTPPRIQPGMRFGQIVSTSIARPIRTRRREEGIARPQLSMYPGLSSSVVSPISVRPAVDHGRKKLTITRALPIAT